MTRETCLHCEIRHHRKRKATRFELFTALDLTVNVLWLCDECREEYVREQEQLATTEGTKR